MSGNGNGSRRGSGPREIYHGNPDRSRRNHYGKDERPAQEECRGPRTGGRRAVPPAVRIDGPHTPAPRRERFDDRPARPQRPVPPPPASVVPETDLDVDSAANILAGRNPIREALRANEPIEKLLVANGGLSGAALDIIRMAKEAGVVVQEVDRTRLDAIYPVNQGMVAYLSDVKFHDVSEMLALAKEKGEDPFLIVLDGITDPHNLGAIVRTAECAGCHGVILPKRRSAGLGPACAKAAAGALNPVMVARVTNLNQELDDLKKQGVWVVGTTMGGENAFRADLTGPVALVIGSEGDGISRLTLEKCDRNVSLPMMGQIGSLNASVAAGIILYEIARQRGMGL